MSEGQPLFNFTNSFFHLSFLSVSEGQPKRGGCIPKKVFSFLSVSEGQPRGKSNSED